MEVKEKIIPIYVTADGKTFEDEYEARNHEKELKEIEETEKEWNSKCVFYNHDNEFLNNICDCHDGDAWIIRFTEKYGKDYYEKLLLKKDGWLENEFSFYEYGSMNGLDYILMVANGSDYAVWVCIDSLKEDLLRDADDLIESVMEEWRENK